MVAGWSRTDDAVQFFLVMMERGLSQVLIDGKLMGIAFIRKLLWRYGPWKPSSSISLDALTRNTKALTPMEKYSLTPLCCKHRRSGQQVEFKPSGAMNGERLFFCSLAAGI
ncbi:hypothetical protein NDU88_004556, partial [Pleurodeles waltl]